MLENWWRHFVVACASSDDIWRIFKGYLKESGTTFSVGRCPKKWMENSTSGKVAAKRCWPRVGETKTDQEWLKQGEKRNIVSEFFEEWGGGGGGGAYIIKAGFAGF